MKPKTSLHKLHQDTIGADDRNQQLMVVLQRGSGDYCGLIQRNLPLRSPRDKCLYFQPF